MTVTIHLPIDLEQTLRTEAARSGQDIGEFVLQAVKEKIAKATLADTLPSLAQLDELATPPAKAWLDDKGWADYEVQ